MLRALFSGEFFHAACLGEVFRSLSFFTFFRGAPCVGREENICRLIVYCVWLSQCAGISLTGSVTIIFPPVVRSLTQTITQKETLSLLTAEKWGQYVCFLSRTVHTWIQHFQPCFLRGIQQLYLQAQTQTNKNDLEEYTTSVWCGPLHPKGKKSSWFVRK